MIGQHVLIDLDAIETEEADPMLPASFVMQEDGRFYVWAANAKNRIERREITLGAYDEETECYPLLGGLTASDRIAFPDDTVHTGMLATEANYLDPDAPVDYGEFGMNGMENGAMIDEYAFDVDMPEPVELGDDASPDFGG